ncbi:MAG: SDR family NAD(P)-dependent oxidoreductase [Nitrospinota bacterium]
MRLQDRVAIVTGGGRGLGEQIARAFAAEGARVVLMARTRNEIDRVAGDLASAGQTALALPGDVSQAEAARHVVDRTLERFGRIDILVNNAGTLYRGRLAEMPTEAISQLVDINVKGLLYMSRAALPVFLERGEGSIINLSSGLGRVGVADFVVYCASKFAVEGITQALAAELKGTGIRVNGLHPGGIADTALSRRSCADLWPEDWLPPDIVREPAVYLASDAAREVTGLVIDATEWTGYQGRRPGLSGPPQPPGEERE